MGLYGNLAGLFLHHCVISSLFCVAIVNCFLRGLIFGYPGPRGFSWFFSRMRWENQSREAARKKNLWLPWTWISLSCRRQSQDLSREASGSGYWLVFLQTRKSIWLVRSIGNTEGTEGIFVTALLEVNFAYLYQGRKLLAKHFTASVWQAVLLSIYTRLRFACVRHGLCSWKCLRSNFDLGTRGAFSRDWKSHRTSEESVARGHKSQGCVRHIANRTWKVNYFSVAPWCLQIPVPVRLFIPSPCHNFGCVSSEVSGWLSYPRTAKPWHFSG